jgi:SAM-dependent methyltransferase
MHPPTGTKDTGVGAADAYEAIAAYYDEQSRGDEWMRRALQAHYLRLFRSGDRVLDVGCGTGTDALALARRGIRVVGVDGSPGMIAQLTAKSAAERLDHLVEAHVLRIAHLGRLTGPFDGLISAFAGLSTEPDLGAFEVDAARLVRGGGRMVLHLLNRFSVWEWLGLTSRRQWQAASTLHLRSARSFTIGNQAVPHTLYSARELYARVFRTRFILRGAYSLGALRPPHTVRRVPRPLVSGLEWLDVRLGSLPWVADAGRFFVLDLERRA